MIILMADIIGSSKKTAGSLMKGFRKTVDDVNEKHRKDILSPLTITLGDEFQGIIKDLPGALAVVFDVESASRTVKAPFTLRYVIHEGTVDTKINRQTAHGMLGPGLSEARSRLTAMKSSRTRFSISLHDEALASRLQLGLNVYQGIVDRWTPAQLKVVNAFETEPDYRHVARKLKRDSTVIWKRKRSLMIDEYGSIRNLILLTSRP